MQKQISKAQSEDNTQKNNKLRTDKTKIKYVGQNYKIQIDENKRVFKSVLTKRTVLKIEGLTNLKEQFIEQSQEVIQRRWWALRKEADLIPKQLKVQIDEGNMMVKMQSMSFHSISEISKHDYSFQAVLKMSMKLLMAVMILHQRGNEHPNLIPQNIMFSLSKDSDFQCLLVDFNEKSTLLLGRQEQWYRAPQILCGNKITQQANIYSCGLILYELLNYGYPLLGTHTFQLRLSNRAHIIDRRLKSIRKYGEEISQIVKIIGMCLEINPNQRPSAKGLYEKFYYQLTLRHSPEEPKIWMNYKFDNRETEIVFEREQILRGLFTCYKKNFLLQETLRVLQTHALQPFRFSLITAIILRMGIYFMEETLNELKLRWPKKLEEDYKSLWFSFEIKKVKNFVRESIEEHKLTYFNQLYLDEGVEGFKSVENIYTASNFHNFVREHWNIISSHAPLQRYVVIVAQLLGPYEVYLNIENYALNKSFQRNQAQWLLSSMEITNQIHQLKFWSPSPKQIIRIM